MPPDTDLVDLGGISALMFRGDYEYERVPAHRRNYPAEDHERDVASGKKPSAPGPGRVCAMPSALKKAMECLWEGGLDFALIDVGCQYGCLSAELAAFVKQRGKSNKIHAFDCGPAGELAPLNFRLNGVDDIASFEKKAVAGAAGPLRVFCDPARTEDCHVNARKREQYPSYEADAVTLDGYLAGRKEKFVVKMDCQGAEMLVFDGMERVLESEPVIVAELAPEITEDMGRDWMGFLEARARDYTLVAIEEDGPAYEVPPRSLNLLRGRLLGTESRWCDILMAPRRLGTSGRLLDWVRSCDNYADCVPGPGAPPPAGMHGYDLKILRSRVDLGRFDEAYSWAREKSGEGPEWLYLSAFAAHMTGRYAESVPIYGRALELGFDAFWVYYNRGQALLSAGEAERGKKDLEAACAIDPANADAKKLLDGLPG